MIKKKALGKGLDALFSDNGFNPMQESDVVQQLRISDVEPNKNQPRKNFGQEALIELADSIKLHGVLQPIIVKPIQDNGYMIIAGERRWRAARMAGLSEIPALVKDIDEADVVEIALIENLQREDLNPVEEALGYKELSEKYGLTQDDISQKVGKSRSQVANTIRILNLPQTVLDMVKDQKLSMGHARTLLSFNKEDIEKYALLTVQKQWSVRQLEEVASNADKAQNRIKSAISREGYYDDIETGLKKQYGNNVNLKVKNGKGKIEFTFKNKAELEDIINRLIQIKFE